MVLVDVWRKFVELYKQKNRVKKGQNLYFFGCTFPQMQTKHIPTVDY